MNSMLSPSEADPKEGTVRLPAHCTTVTAEDLRVRLVLAADLDGRMIVDASDVQSVGQAVIQLLLAAHAEAERCDQYFSVVNPSPAFVERLTSCGLADTLGLESRQGDHS